MVMLISPAASSNFTTCFVTCPRRGGDWGATKRASAFVHLFAASNPSSNTFNFQNHPQNDDLLTYCFLGCFVRFKSIQNAPPPPPFSHGSWHTSPCSLVTEPRISPSDSSRVMFGTWGRCDLEITLQGNESRSLLGKGTIISWICSQEGRKVGPFVLGYVISRH